MESLRSAICHVLNKRNFSISLNSRSFAKITWRHLWTEPCQTVSPCPLSLPSLLYTLQLWQIPLDLNNRWFCDSKQVRVIPESVDRCIPYRDQFLINFLLLYYEVLSREVYLHICSFVRCRKSGCRDTNFSLAIE